MAKNDDKKPTTDAPTDEGAHAFAHVLARIDDGCLHAEASEELRELVKKLSNHAYHHTKAKGEITLKLSLSMENGIVTVRGDVKTKAPPPKRGASVFWETKGYNLSPKNPRQVELPLREVPRTTDTPREAPAAKQAAPTEA